MIAFGVSNISLAFGTDAVLSDISFSVNEGDRLGIVGVNGAGKSSLMKIMAGTMEATSGSVFTAKGASLEMLAQNAMLDSSATVYEEMLTAFAPLVSLEKEIADMAKEIENRSDQAGTPAYEELITRYTDCEESFREQGGYEYRGRIRSMLAKFGFDESFHSSLIRSLSGGERTRLALVRLLLLEPDILFLDEPTNHLDTETLEWLEDHLCSYPHTVAVISHDRYFLDRVATKMLDIEHTKATLYTGNYTAFVQKKKQAAEIYEHHYKNQQKEIARIEAYIEQQRRWNRERNIIAAESREKALARMDKLDAPKAAPGTIKLVFDEAEQSGNDVIYAERLSKSYGDREIFSDLSFLVRKNDRILIIGPNGCGKSTLAKILGGLHEQSSGVVEFGHNVYLGYYDQEQQTLDENSTVLAEVIRAHENLTITQIRSALAAFLFFAEDMEKPISSLSGGEKARLMLCKMILSKVNLLILDEPTNHLDIPSREILENALLSFGGTIIAVSHDRYFISKIATRIWDMKGGSLFDYAGGYEDYTAYRHSLSAPVPEQTVEKKEIGSKTRYQQDKQKQSEIRKRERIMERNEEKIEELEKQKFLLSEEASTGAATDYIRLSEITEQIQSIDLEIECLFNEMAEAEDYLKENR